MWLPQYLSLALKADEATGHRGKAIRALRGIAPVSVRLARYNFHMATARRLDAKSAFGKNLETLQRSPASSTQDVGGPI